MADTISPDLPTSFMRARLDARARAAGLRELRPQTGSDFCSNDYLGCANSEDIRSRAAEIEARYAHIPSGATGSRLITGQHALLEDLERFIADYHHTPAALIHTSGYTANCGLLSCIPQRGDYILYDQHVHASIRDGIRLSVARSYPFRHNDLDDLRAKLLRFPGRRFVVVESLYSMDGDAAPLRDICRLCAELDALVLVDEAHAGGIVGPQGQGLVAQEELSSQVFARVITFGKAFGGHGAVVLGSRLLRDYLVNYSRPFIYSTGLPKSSLAWIWSAYEFIAQSDSLREILHERIRQFDRAARERNLALPALPQWSPIRPVIVPGNIEVQAVSKKLLAGGFDVRAVRSPTVPKGNERLRFCLHVFNDEDHIESVVALMAAALRNAI